MRKMSIRNLAVSVVCGFALVASGAVAQSARRAAVNTGMPDALKRAAIATRSDESGLIAGTRIENTDTWVVYVETRGGCGSGGCRAQIWKREGAHFVRGESLQVGQLPITILPQILNGMPMLGVTVFDKESAKSAIRADAFDGRNYTQQSGRLLPANSGRPLLTRAMLRPF